MDQPNSLLIVEDDEDFARLLVLSLEARGLTADVVDSVSKALALLEVKSYHLISLDAFLGQDNCGTIVSALRDENHLNHTALLVILSAHAGKDFINRIESKGHRAFNKGADLKPYYDYVQSCFQEITEEMDVQSASESIEMALEKQLGEQVESMLSEMLIEDDTHKAKAS